MRVSVMEPWGLLYEGHVREALLPGEDGELTVLDFHHPFLCRLRRGAVQLLTSGTKRGGRVEVEARIPITDGVARMAGNELVILVETSAPGRR